MSVDPSPTPEPSPRSRKRWWILALSVPLLVVVPLLLISCLGSGAREAQVFSQINSGLTNGGYHAVEEEEEEAEEEAEEDDSASSRLAPPSSPASPPPPPAGVTLPKEDAPDRGRAGDADEEELEAEEREFPDTDGGDGEGASGAPEPAARPQGRPAPLKAGERDDNELFEEYLRYLDTYRGPSARTIDVSERYLITVLNDQQHPLLDARVRIYDGREQLFEGRTYAGGQTIFLPRAYGVSPNTTEFRIVAEYGNDRAETTLSRSPRTPAQERVELVVADAQPPEDLHLDILFLLDTTGSMNDELSRIQETIDSIARRIDALTPRPVLRFGLVAYRDRGDDYITRRYDFTGDVDSFRRQLNSFSADGGGDTPESLNEGLHEAVQDVRWTSESAVRLIFLVADAGPHLDYEQDYDYAEEIQQAVTRGIKIYPIAASNTDDFAEYVFRQLAQQTLARFIFLTYQSGERSGTPGESTTLESGDQPYTVEQLDDLIVQVVQRELARASGQE